MSRLTTAAAMTSVPSHLTFSGGGCWKVTARLGASTIRFTVQIPRGRAAVCASLTEQLDSLRSIPIDENLATAERFEAAARATGCAT